MKKLILLLAVAVISATSIAQDAAAIVSRYEKATGVNSLDLSSPDFSIMMEMSIAAQGQNMPMKCILQGKDNMRIEMEAMGQKMLIVRNGDKGSITIPGQGTQAMPKEMLDQQTSQMDIISSLKWSPDKYTFEYKGADVVDGKDVEKVMITPKVADKKNLPLTAFFDKSTGLVVKTENSINGTPIETLMGDYKKFGDLMLPQVITVKSKGAEISKVQIKSFELDFPTEAWMFADPK